MDMKLSLPFTSLTGEQFNKKLCGVRCGEDVYLMLGVLHCLGSEVWVSAHWRIPYLS